MKERQQKELRLIFIFLTLVFFCFLAVPAIRLFIKSFWGDSGFVLDHYASLFSGEFQKALKNSFLSAGLSASLTTLAAFGLACGIHYTRIPNRVKQAVRGIVLLPMLLPTITYGFALIYTFGNQGLVTRLLGQTIFPVYGLGGLVIGYMIYTLPVSFLLILNTMEYVDKRFMIVSRVMGDTPWRTFHMTVLRPLWGTLAASFVQCFFLAFTDYGIPASVGGEYRVAASCLYDWMLGSLPDFSVGAAAAVVMLLPSIFSIGLLRYLNRFNVRYSKRSDLEMEKNPIRDFLLGSFSIFCCAVIFLVFSAVFFVPFVSEWPYRMLPTMEHVKEVFADPSLLNVFCNSIFAALATAAVGSITAYGAALVTSRSSLRAGVKNTVETIALVTNTIPGMVLGIAFMLVFSGGPLQNTFFLIIICNVVHFFSTPYLMMKNSLEKMNGGWETTAMLMGDSWLKTIVRVVTPNAMGTILEVFCYYFVNAMVTVSAVIFLTGSKTMVLTAKMKELQHFAKFNEIFVLSLAIFFTNLAARIIFTLLARQKGNKRRIPLLILLIFTLLLGAKSAGMFGNGEEKRPVIIYSNADDEAAEAVKAALNEAGYGGKYQFQTFATSELGGKLLAEQSSIEADLVTMSSFYLESAMEQSHMFLKLACDQKPLDPVPDYYRPLTAQEGAILVNTQVLEERGLPMPDSIKDLADPVYQDMVSVTDVKSSSTGWLLIQALVSQYGEEEGGTILTGIYQNAGPHIESSGSGPLKKVRAGEVAIGFGLRHQAAADKEAGLPVDFVDPVEGNFSLTESVAVVDKKEHTHPLAMEMAECIITYARPDLQEIYPNPLYEGEKRKGKDPSRYPRTFGEPLTAELLRQHQELSENSRKVSQGTRKNKVK